MNIPRYSLFRYIITDTQRQELPFVKQDDTHLVVIEIFAQGKKWSSSTRAINPSGLRPMISLLKGSLISAINYEYGKDFVTSIG